MENDKTTDLLNIKNEIIEIFKVNLTFIQKEKLETTKILQDQLKSQVALLNSKMVF